MSVRAPSSSRARGSVASPRRPQPHRRFEESLACARRPAAVRQDPPAAALRASPPPSARPPSGAAPWASRGEPEPVAPGLSSAAPPTLTRPIGIPELQAALRAAPPAIAAALRDGQPQLVLGFGAALSIDLRVGAGGVEVLVRPAASLAGAAQAELPRLVEALRGRGLRVARAELRLALPDRSSPERVDDPGGVR